MPQGLGSHTQDVQISHLNLSLIAYSIQNKLHEMCQLLGPWPSDWPREGTISMAALALEQLSGVQLGGDTPSLLAFILPCPTVGADPGLGAWAIVWS